MNARRALAFIFCTVTLDVLALGIMIPVLPTIVLGFMDGDTAGAAKVFGLFATAWGLMQFLCSPLLGALSDRYGRRPVILISCLGLGFVLGPAIGGLLGGLDPRLPFWVSAAACLINAAFGWFVLPESLPPERRMAFEWKRANPVGSLNLLRSQRQLLGLATIDFIVNVAHQVLPSVFVLYAAYRYGWDETTVGLTLAFVGICSAIVQGLIVGPAVTWLGPRRALIAGLLFGGLGMVIYGLAPSGPWFWLGVPVMSLWGITGPTIMDMMSRKVSPSEQGQLQGANSSSRSVTGLLGPAIFTATFAWLIHWLPGAPFLLAALLLVAAAAVAWVVTAPTPGAGRSP